MNIENFNLLSSQEKTGLLLEATGITEKLDDTIKYQLFKLGDFYVETRTSLLGKSTTTLHTYTLKDLPAKYLSQLLSIPLVLNNNKTGEITRNKNTKGIKILK